MQDEIRMGEVERMTGVGRATILRWIGQGHFPPPYRQLSPRLRYWSKAQVLAWLESKRVRQAV